MPLMTQKKVFLTNYILDIINFFADFEKEINFVSKY